MVRPDKVSRLFDISEAHRKFSASDWGQADSCHLPFADRSFDAVAFSSGLHHTPTFMPAGRRSR
jgi:ubiquinone/menaquinone biosynthesis C-methylase UbiE